MQTATATVELDESLMQFRATLDASSVEGFSAAHIHDGDLEGNIRCRNCKASDSANCIVPRETHHCTIQAIFCQILRSGGISGS